MSFKSLSLVIILGCSACLEAFHASTTTAAGPAAYTTITNTIDAMGVLKPTEENITGGYRGQNLYHGEKEDDVISNPRISEPNHHQESPDVPIVSETLPLSSLREYGPRSSVSGISTTVTVVGGQVSPLISYVGVDSGPSIRISSGPGVRTISYSTPGGVLITHGSPGTSYVLSTHHPASYFFEDHRIPQSVSSVENFGPSADRPVPIPAIGNSGYIRSLDPSSIINLVTKRPFPSVQATGVDGSVYNSAHDVVYRNLQRVKEIVAGISRKLDNFAWIGV